MSATADVCIQVTDALLPFEGIVHFPIVPDVVRVGVGIFGQVETGLLPTHQFHQIAHLFGCQAVCADHRLCLTQFGLVPRFADDTLFHSYELAILNWPGATYWPRVTGHHVMWWASGCVHGLDLLKRGSGQSGMAHAYSTHIHAHIGASLRIE